jgi:hypothetical protein
MLTGVLHKVGQYQKCINVRVAIIAVVAGVAALSKYSLRIFCVSTGNTKVLAFVKLAIYCGGDK